MKIRFLGTAASEGFPAVFCNCEYCKKARELKGKNIRTRHQTLINDDLLIDFPADTYFHALVNELRLDKVKYLLITHVHSDHFYPTEIANVVAPYAHEREIEVINIYGGKDTESVYQSEFKDFTLNGFQDKVKFNVVKYFEPINIGDGYVITYLPARHDFKHDAGFYIIEKDGKRILYAHDTGIFYEQVFEYIEKNKLVFDFISLDCTNVTLVFPDESSHMGFSQIERVLKKLEDLNAINAKTIKYVNHFSHNGNPDHERVCEYVKEDGFVVSYDGLSIEF